MQTVLQQSEHVEGLYAVHDLFDNSCVGFVRKIGNEKWGFSLPSQQTLVTGYRTRGKATQALLSEVKKRQPWRGTGRRPE